MCCKELFVNQESDEQNDQKIITKVITYKPFDRFPSNINIYSLMIFLSI